MPSEPPASAAPATISAAVTASAEASWRRVASASPAASAIPVPVGRERIGTGERRRDPGGPAGAPPLPAGVRRRVAPMTAIPPSPCSGTSRDSRRPPAKRRTIFSTSPGRCRRSST